MLDKIKNWLMARLKERSTYVGAVAVATGCGVVLTPEQANAILAVGAIIGGGVSAGTADK
jgi:hypothetical protein